MRTPTMTILGLAAAATVAIACGAGGDDVAGPGAQDAAAGGGTAKKTIVIEVTGAKKADVTYGLNTDQSQANGTAVPWKKTLTTTEPLTIVTLLAQNKGGGTISCKITVDGKVVKTNSSEGEYAIATCTADNL